MYNSKIRYTDNLTAMKLCLTGKTLSLIMQEHSLLYFKKYVYWIFAFLTN